MLGVIAFATLCAGMAGCNKSRLDALPPVYPVRGEVYVGNQPAVGAVVAFHPTGEVDGPKSTSRGTADGEGKFSLTTYTRGDGAPEGDYIVTVYWPVRPLNPDGEGHDLPADKLQGRFATTTKSNLRARVGPAPVVVPRLDLGQSSVAQSQEYFVTGEASQ